MQFMIVRQCNDAMHSCIHFLTDREYGWIIVFTVSLLSLLAVAGRGCNYKCEEGDAAVIRWTPDDNTPDLLYYQVRCKIEIKLCFTYLRQNSDDYELGVR